MDGIGEIKEAMERLIERKVDSINTSWGISPGTPLIAPTNPNVSQPDLNVDQLFTTAYSGGVTVLPIVFDISAFDSTDEFTG